MKRRCIEQGKLIGLDEDVFYQPIPRYNDDKPLSHCVITISGFNAYEKDNISNFCQLLGATIQQSLSLKRTAAIMANTHLICKTAIGPKYIAAKSWQLPIVCVEWLVECCVTGMKANEKTYSFDNQRDMKELIKNLASIRRKDESYLSNSYNDSDNKASYGLVKNNNNKQPDVNTSHSMTSKHGCATVEQNLNDSSFTSHNESKKPRLEKSKTNETLSECPKHDDTADEGEKDDDDEEEEEDDDYDDACEVLAAIENNGIQKKPSELSKNANTMPMAAFGTPCNPRLKELRRTDTHFTPVAQTFANENSNHVEDNRSINEKTSKQVLTTPIWMKPKKDGENQIQFNFDYAKVRFNYLTDDTVLSAELF